MSLSTRPRSKASSATHVTTKRFTEEESMLSKDDPAQIQQRAVIAAHDAECDGEAGSA